MTREGNRRTERRGYLSLTTLALMLGQLGDDDAIGSSTGRTRRIYFRRMASGATRWLLLDHGTH